MVEVLFLLILLLAFSTGACLTERNYEKIKENCDCRCEDSWSIGGSRDTR
jgi:hypothetical protein